MRDCFVPGTGFPLRLQALLLRLGKRHADVEREAQIDADTVSGWINRRHYPEKVGFLKFCRCYRINQEEAKGLLRQPGEAELILLTDAERLLRRLSRAVAQIVPAVGDLGPTERAELQILAEELQEALKCSPTTMTKQPDTS